MASGTLRVLSRVISFRFSTFQPGRAGDPERVARAVRMARLYNNYNGYNLGQRITSIPSIKIDQVMGVEAEGGILLSTTPTPPPSSPRPTAMPTDLPDLLTGARGSIPIGGPTFRLNYDYTITPTLLAHFGARVLDDLFLRPQPLRPQDGGKTVNCLADASASGLGEGSLQLLPTIIAG